MIMHASINGWRSGQNQWHWHCCCLFVFGIHEHHSFGGAFSLGCRLPTGNQNAHNVFLSPNCFCLIVKCSSHWVVSIHIPTYHTHTSTFITFCGMHLNADWACKWPVVTVAHSNGAPWLFLSFASVCALTSHCFWMDKWPCIIGFSVINWTCALWTSAPTSVCGPFLCVFVFDWCFKWEIHRHQWWIGSMESAIVSTNVRWACVVHWSIS